MHKQDIRGWRVMFNTTNNEFNYNINAVSGTLRKSHPKSKFTVKPLKDNLYMFRDEKPILEYGNWNEIVILQTMLIGNDRALIEYVNKEDFEQSEVADSE